MPLSSTYTLTPFASPLQNSQEILLSSHLRKPTPSHPVAMQGDPRDGPPGYGGFRLELIPTESAEKRIQRLISENPVIIFSRSSCCMCDVMKRLLYAIGVHPTVIELEEDEIAALSPREGGDSSNEDSSQVPGGASGAPALYIGGERIGGPESLVKLHLSNHLVPKLVQVGALRNEFLII